MWLVRQRGGAGFKNPGCGTTEEQYHFWLPLLRTHNASLGVVNF